MALETENPSFWDEKYKNGETRWDLNSSNPPFLEVISDKKIIEPCRILIPGCGKGYDAIEAAKKGFEVTALDFSEFAIGFAKELAEKESGQWLRHEASSRRIKINFICEDIFNLSENYNNSFDAVYDYTMLCAINPEKRNDYAKKISSLLKTKGKFIAVLFPVEKREGGPPFEINIFDAYKIFSKYLKLFLSSKKINSVERRKGREVLQVYIK